jgi:predicted HD phosphohydrolase
MSDLETEPQAIGKRANFTAMADTTAEEWDLIESYYPDYMKELPDRILDHVKLLRRVHFGFAVDRYTHSLQTATRALRDGRDEEFVVCALLHDMGSLGPMNHAEVAAIILKPFVSGQNHWMVEKHGIFQGYYFFHLTGRDRNMRDQFRSNPWFDYTEEFCRKYDQNSFDPDYDTLPLEAFEPMVRRVFASPKRSIYLPDEG